VQLTLVKAEPKPDPLDELYYAKPIRQHVQEFSCIMSIVLLIIAGVKIYLRSNFALGLSLTALAAVLLLLGYGAPAVLRPIWKGWMYLAEKLGAFVNVILLSLAWAIAVVPIALVVRIFRTKVMDLSFKAEVPSYWEERNPASDNFDLLKRQF